MKNNEILHIPSLNVFGDWEDLQYYLGKKGNPLFSIEDNLDLSHTDIESLGNLTSVGGNLVLGGCHNLTSLGNLTSVRGNLSLIGCHNLTSLGNLTSVGKSLDLENCENLTSLGNLTSVGKSLDLKRTPISKKCSEEEIKQMVDIGGDIYS